MSEHLPVVYTRFRDEFPDVLEAQHRLTDLLHRAGPLDDRERRLAKLGIAIGTSSPGAVRSHARKALGEGIDPDAILHVALLAISTAGFPSAIAAYGWIREVLEGEKPAG